MHTFNLTTVSNDELDKFRLKLPELKKFLLTCEESVKTNR